MTDKTIHLTFTPAQAKALLTALRLAKQMFEVGPNVPVYPNLGDRELERDLIKAELGATEESLFKQMLEQMPDD